MTKLDELIAELSSVHPRDSGYAELAQRAVDALTPLREHLEAIESTLTEEIHARFRHHSMTPQEAAGKSAIYSLLVLPRDVARSGLEKAGAR